MMIQLMTPADPPTFCNSAGGNQPDIHLPITQCVCHSVSFAQMKTWMAEHQADLAALQEEFGCGQSCGLCLPYIHAMLRTGRTAFALNDPDVPPM